MSAYVDEEALRSHVDKVVPLKLAEASAQRAVRFTRERIADIEPSYTEWLVKHFMPAHGVAILYGPSTVGKSFVALYWALRICRGKHIFNHKTTKAGALYIAAEGQNGMRKRIKALRDNYGLSDVAFQFIGAGINLLDDAHVDGLCEAACEARDEMRTEVGVGLGLVIIDTTSAAMPGGNENSGEDMSKVLAAGQRIGAESGALVLFIAHPGKNEALGVRGWSGQHANVDAVYSLVPSEDDPKLRVGTVKKLKDGEDGEQFAYRLKQVDMGIDADGDRITSAYPDFNQALPTESGKRKQPKLGPGPELILRALGQLIDEAGQTCPVPPVPGVRPGTKGVTRSTLRERVMRMGYAADDDKPDTVKRSFNRDLQKLVVAMAARLEGDVVWLAK